MKAERQKVKEDKMRREAVAEIKLRSLRELCKLDYNSLIFFCM